jgi:hypothetical protein
MRESTMNKNLRKMAGARTKSSLSAALLMVLAVCIGNASEESKPPNYPTGKIELEYYKDGPWTDLCVVRNVYCGDPMWNCDLYYPAKLGTKPGRKEFHHPVLTWGNGVTAQAWNYEYFLKHMASWGFVVIATRDPYTTGDGKRMVAALRFLKERNDDSNSCFYQKLDPHQVGSFGHSEGASGAINAMILSTEVKTAVAIELPRRWACWVIFNNLCTKTSQLTSGSIFLIDGSADSTSPPLQPWWAPVGLFGPQSIEAFYNEAPNPVEKVKGTLIGPNHNDVQGQPNCSNTLSCENGVFGYLGYPTAWMMAQLQGDPCAKSAFKQGSGEIFAQPTNWEYVASNLH